MAKTVRITFDQSGNVEADALGFKGKGCAETTAKLLAGLQALQTNEDKKPEFNMLTTSTDKIAQRW